MAKKDNILITPMEKTPIDPKFSIEKKEELLRLRKLTSPSKEDMDSIFNLYKLYVNPNQSTYSATCSCNNSISNLYWSLIGYFEKNITLWHD